jgi:hypothetical protein
MYDNFEDTKRLTRNRNSKKDRQSNGQMKEDKQDSTKHYTENFNYPQNIISLK